MSEYRDGTDNGYKPGSWGAAALESSIKGGEVDHGPLALFVREYRDKHPNDPPEWMFGAWANRRAKTVLGLMYPVDLAELTNKERAEIGMPLLEVFCSCNSCKSIGSLKHDTSAPSVSERHVPLAFYAKCICGWKSEMHARSHDATVASRVHKLASRLSPVSPGGEA